MKVKEVDAGTPHPHPTPISGLPKFSNILIPYYTYTIWTCIFYYLLKFL